MFDFDGTIVDSMKELTIIASGLVNKYYGLSISFAERLYIEASGLSFCQQMEIMFLGYEKNKIIVEIFETLKTYRNLSEPNATSHIHTIHGNAVPTKILTV